MAGVAPAWLVVVAAWAWACAGVQGFSQGAPDTTCDTLEPVHGVPRQSGPAPYTLTPGAPLVAPGEQVLVTLEGQAGSTFKGFVVQARSSDTQRVVGTFFTTDHKYLNCQNGMNNAVTHRGAARKSKVTLTWEPPSDFTGDVVFTGTFVRDRTVFWVGVTSEKVTVTKREAVTSTEAPPPTTTTTAPTTAPTTVFSTATTPASSSVSPGPEAVNAGDDVINIVDAPSAVAENDVNVASTIDDSVPPPTVDTPPSSISPSPSPSSTIAPSTSLSTSPAPAGSPLTSTESSVSITEGTTSSPPPQSPPAAKPPATRRKFGIFNRRKTTTVAPATTTAATAATPPINILHASIGVSNQDLSPEAQSMQRQLVNIYDECGISKGCFGMPSGCEKDGNCNIMTTYTRVSSGYRFEVMGTTASKYFAVGLSDDEKMGDDSVMACRILDGVTDVRMAHNTGRDSELLSSETYGLSDINTLNVDGKVYCNFVRQPRTEIKDIVFDLDKTRYHLMLAMGEATADRLNYHSNGRQVSRGTVSLSQFESVEGASDLFRTLHACFMVGAWVCAASCGIIIARYYKKTWLKNKACGIDQWFHLHRFFMGLTWGLTMAGLALIIYYLNGWTKMAPHENPHAIIGIISTGLCFIQPFMALCRCSPDHKRRPLFNWLHWLVGNCAQILGITAIFFGLELVGAPEWTTFILIIFIAFHCLVHLILSIGQCVSDSKAENSNNVYPTKEINSSRNPLHPTQVKEDAPGGGFRKAMLGLYFFVNWIITAALLLIIIVGEEQLREWGLLFWEDTQ